MTAGSKRSKRVESSQFVPVHGVEKVEKPNEVAFDPTRTSTPTSTRESRGERESVFRREQFKPVGGRRG